MYLIIHAFSRRNAGDGLLVDLTMEALEAAGVEREQCAILALDPESFEEDKMVFRAPGEPFAQINGRLFLAGVELLVSAGSGGRLGTVANLVSKAKGLIAVGGGYLVGDSLNRQAGILLNHFAQLAAAAKTNLPTVYLPQSIGPLHGPSGSLVRKQLGRMDRVFVRDDQTFQELALTNTRRVGDLAVLKLAREIENIKPVDPQGQAIIVARDLPRPDQYLERLGALAHALPNAKWAVQADVRGRRSDLAFYERHGYSAAGKFADLLNSGTPGVVISVRLHGAIAGLLAGRPAIHLSYERKGWGAYQDLGIGEYVHDARDFDVKTVLQQVRMLQSDPHLYWKKIHAAAPRLTSQYSQIVNDLRRLMGVEGLR